MYQQQSDDYQAYRPWLTNKSTNWELFRAGISDQLSLNEKIKWKSELNLAEEKFSTLIINAARETTTSRVYS